jgi:hypothetical protein
MLRSFKGNKFRARPVVVNGERFDSKKEAKRWLVLQMLNQSGEIKNLQRQVSIPLFAAGKKICTYRADYKYERNGQTVIEDAKGYQTDVFKIKWKWAQAMHPEWEFVLS